MSTKAITSNQMNPEFVKKLKQITGKKINRIFIFSFDTDIDYSIDCYYRKHQALTFRKGTVEYNQIMVQIEFEKRYENLIVS